MDNAADRGQLAAETSGKASWRLDNWSRHPCDTVEATIHSEAGANPALSRNCDAPGRLAEAGGDEPGRL